MASNVINFSGTVAGIAVTGQNTRSTDGHAAIDALALPVGNAGSLTTRTDNDTGVATLSGGHSITTGMTCDVYWTGGCRFGMAATVAVNAVTLDGGAGDNLPVQDTAVVVTQQVVAALVFDGDDMNALVVQTTGARAHVNFKTAGAASSLALDIPAGEVYCWCSGQDVTTPITGDDIATIAASCGSSSAAATLTVGVAYDSTP